MATPKWDIPKDLTLDKLWEYFYASSDRFEREAARRQTEWDKQQAERRAEWDKQKAEWDRQQAERDRRFDRLSENVGGLNRSMGELVETLIAARLWEKFSAYPYNLQRAYQRIPIYDENNKVLTDIDILLVDGEWAMAVEVKREADRTDEVERHIKRMGRIQKYPPALVTGKKLLGAIAGGVVSPDVMEEAHAAGFFVLELKGEAVELLPPPAGFKPMEW